MKKRHSIKDHVVSFLIQEFERGTKAANFSLVKLYEYVNRKAGRKVPESTVMRNLTSLRGLNGWDITCRDRVAGYYKVTRY